MNQKNEPELFSEMRQLAKDLGIQFSKKTTIAQLEFKIRQALFELNMEDDF